MTSLNSGETLIGTSVIDIISHKGTASNNYGFYSITLPEGKVVMQLSYTGFATQQHEFLLHKDTILNISLSDYIELNEVTVTASQKEFGAGGSQMSAINVPMAVIKTVPMLFGESDIIKSLQLMPGVQAGTEGSTGFYVRGGGPDENLFLLDGVPVYNVSHIAGFFSVFNTDAVKNVTLYKGGFPARFGGRLSSVVDIRLNDGNNKKIGGNVSVGLISSKINLEGPIFDEKTTFSFSARRSYFDLLTKPALNLIKFEDGFKVSAGYFFYDINLKIMHKLNEKNRIYLSLYNGQDAINSEINDSWKYDNDNITESNKLYLNWKWGNNVALVRWNRILTNKLFLNTSATFTNYKFNTTMGNEFKTEISEPNQITEKKYLLNYFSGITDYGLKTDFDYSPSPNHDVKFGSSITYHIFKPGITTNNINSESESLNIQKDTTFDNNNIKALDFVVYAEDNWNITNFLKANIGLHFAAFNVQNTFYQSLQPRLSLRALISDKFSLKAGFASMQQFIHLLAYNNFSLPNDLWVPVTEKIKPMESVQYSAGAFYNLGSTFDLSLEGYYKTMKNLIEYMDGASFFESSSGWENKVVSGDGKAYGLELLVQKNIGKTTGWLGYTWSKTERLFNRSGQKLNNGNPFPAKYDRRNDVSLVVSHQFSEKFDLSGTLKYSSGSYVTLAMQNYKGFSEFDGKLPYFSQRNNYQLPDYFRIDAGVNFHKQLKNGKRTWNISIYNVTNTMNPFYLFVKTYKYNDPNTGIVTSEKKFNKITIFTIIPSISYIYKF
ncbi:MAG TPA: TonB-dependent receptor plug domain-containing protein [Paludibacter sp.]|nr:TonB-dependent receptor plug domain-containing protein [Paludibacter sp.]